MFTIDQIKAAHSKVKSGADFPAYIQELAALGVAQYSSFLEDGRTVYISAANEELVSPPKYDTLLVPENSNSELFIQYLKNHQQGQTDYPTFCSDAAKTGVEKWVVDLKAMTCIYYGKAGNTMQEEQIPMPVS